MGRYLGPSCRLCRREGIKLFMKGKRCVSDKCTILKRKYPPGPMTRRRPKTTDYGIRLREKQKAKRLYGLMEGQFHSYFKIATKRKEMTGEILLQLLETRLDNIVYRLHFASSRKQARQIVLHGHITVNGKRVDIPSYQVKEGDIIQVIEKSRKMLTILESLKNVSREGVVGWLSVDADKCEGRVLAIPRREDIELPVQEQLIVEFYSK